jgi:PST family polysaccharide transporter
MTFGAGISNYLRWSTATQVITSFNWQMDQLLLGKLISRVELGQFSMASNLSFMPSQIIVNQVTGPGRSFRGGAR